MRNIPEVGAGFEATRAATAVNAVTREIRRGLRARIGKSVHGWHPSEKVGSTEFVGQSQAEAMRVLDLRADVAAYVTWPVEVRFSDEGATHAWVPDFGIRFRDGRRAVLDLLSRDEAAFFRRSGMLGLVLRALREWDIAYIAREQATFSASRPCLNAAYAMRFRNAFVDDALGLRIEDLLATGEKRTLSGLRDLLAPAGGVTATACAMAWAGRLALGLDAAKPLSMPVRLAGGLR